MVLNPIAGEDPGTAVVQVDRNRDGHGALRIEQPVALVFGNTEVIGDDAELLPRHLEDRA